MRRVLTLAVVLAFGSALPAAQPTPGKYRLSSISPTGLETPQCIVNLAMKDGGWTAEVLASHERLGEFTGGKAEIKNGLLTFPLKLSTGANLTFEGVLTDDRKLIRGSLASERMINPALLSATTEDKIDPSARRKLPESIAAAKSLESGLTALQLKFMRATDPDEKKKALEEFNTKQKEIAEKAPELYRKAAADESDPVAALDAAMALIRGAKRFNLDDEGVKKAALLAIKHSAACGPRMSVETKLGVLDMMAANPKLLPGLVELARETEKGLGADAGPLKMERVLTVLHAALGTSREAAAVAERLEAVAAKADAEYVSKQPKIDVKPYAGRKDDGTQVVLMELFTGAQCPPCVAADVAFDKLSDAYKPAELVLLQYHMHIPGPDPLTNPDTEARFAYYRKADATKVRGTPTTVFNGKVEAGGGGGIANAPNKLSQYRGVIDPMLNEKAKAKVTVSAVQAGDKITVLANVSDIAEPGDQIKLRVALVEEVVRYTGGNGLRLHHHVVRAMPGGADGTTIAGKAESTQLVANLGEIRGKLNEYLDNYAKNRPFPKPNRPMEFKHLKVVAWLQDDKSHEVLQAVQADVRKSGAGAE